MTSYIFIFIFLHLLILKITATPPHLIKIKFNKKSPVRLTNSLIDAFHFTLEMNALAHTDRHTGGLFGKISGHLFQSGTVSLWTPAIQLMSPCESINLSTKPYFVGQKALSMAAKDRKNKRFTFHQWVKERPRVSIKRENCYHYRGKAKKV